MKAIHQLAEKEEELAHIKEQLRNVKGQRPS